MRQKRLRWFIYVVKIDEQAEKKEVLELKIEEQRKRGRPVKQWIDMVEEDMEKEGICATG